MNTEYDTQYAQAAGAGEEPPPRPAFFKRLWMVFVQPGDLFSRLALNPAWFPMALPSSPSWPRFRCGSSRPRRSRQCMEARVPPDQAAQMPDISTGVHSLVHRRCYRSGDLRSSSRSS